MKHFFIRILSNTVPESLAVENLPATSENKVNLGLGNVHRVSGH
jgi:hypothetical protein